MPDNAVAAQVNVNSMGNLSSILGIKQQQLALQQQAQGLQIGAQTLAQKEVQTQEAQGVNDFFTNVDLSKHIAGDGTTDIDAVMGDPEFQRIPGVARTAVVNKLQEIKGKQIQNAQGLMQMGTDTLALGGRVLGGVAMDPDVVAGTENGRAKVRAALRQWGELGGAPAQKALLPYQSMADGQLSEGELPARISAIQRSADTALQRQQAVTNAAGQIVGRDPLTGALSAPPIAGNAARINPTSPVIAGQTAATTGQVASDNDRFSSVMKTAATAQSGIALADQVAALAKQVRTGTLSKEWADKLTLLQQDNPQITARQMLGKYAAQLKTLAESNAATDSERAQISSGMPSPESMDPGATQEAANYLHGYFRLAQSRGVNAAQHVARNGTAGLTLNDTQFAGSRDPFVYAFRDMNRQDQKDFLLRRFGAGKSAALDSFENRVNARD